MKSVSVEAKRIIDKLVAGLDLPGDAKTFDAHGYTKKWNGSIMAVHVDNIGSVPSIGSGCLYSIAHYFKQNGDMMRDPEMIFWAGGTHNKNLGWSETYYPVYFRQDPMIEQESAAFEDGKLKGIRVKMQADHVKFANFWMHNIKEQQGL